MSADELGRLLQSFHLELQRSSSCPSSSSDRLASLISALNSLEDFSSCSFEEQQHEQSEVNEEQATDEQGEVDGKGVSSSSSCVAKAEEEVTREIVMECQRRAASVIRQHFSETIRSIITSCRRLFMMKTNTSTTSSVLKKSAEHGQRHLNAIVELLGSWSNVLDELLSHNVSEELLSLVASPLHVRICEAAASCFQDFKENKNLAQWHRKAAPPSNSSNHSKDSEDPHKAVNSTPISLVTLDYMLCQLVSMRAVVYQYQYFLAEKCSLLSLAEDASMQSWLELDACYVSLEGLYLQTAVQEALQLNATRMFLMSQSAAQGEVRKRLPWQQLLETQEGVFSLQSIEDFFFVVTKVVERALQSNTESSIFAVCSQVVELLSPSQEEDQAFSSDNSCVYNILSRKRHYSGIFGLKDEEDLPGKLESTKENDDCSDKDEHYNNNNDLLAMSSAVGENLAQTTLAFADSITSGYAASWFSSALSGDSGNEGSNNESNARDGSITSSIKEDVSTSAPSTAKSTVPQEDSFSNMQEAFLSALELDSVAGAHDGVLALCDEAVLINSLATAVHSIKSLQDMVGSYIAQFRTSESEGCQHMQSIGIMVEELERCFRLYDSLLASEINALEREYLLPIIEQNVRKLLLTHPRSHGEDIATEEYDVFEMNGDDIDRIQKDLPANPLVTCIKTVFSMHENSSSVASGGSNTATTTTVGVSRYSAWREHLTRDAVNEVLLCVATTINDGIMNIILGSTVAEAVFDAIGSFQTSAPLSRNSVSSSGSSGSTAVQGMRMNEWGALLLYDYVMDAINELESIAESEGGISIRHCFLQLIWTMKILTLDQPADLLRCKIPYEQAGFVPSTSHGDRESRTKHGADIVKCILSRRTDFSREAIIRIKINAIES